MNTWPTMRNKHTGWPVNDIFPTLFGIFIFVQCVHVMTAGPSCDRSYLGRLGTGTIQSYNFPFDYLHNLTCRYRIYLDHRPPDAKTTNTICFTFHKFMLENMDAHCTFDYVRFDGQYKYCAGGQWSRGNIDLPQANVWRKDFCWTTQGTYFEIVLKTDNSINHGGFYATFNVRTGQPLVTSSTSSGDSGHQCIAVPSCLNSCSHGRQRDVNGCPTCKCLPREAPCGPSEYTCFNRKCILSNQTCDGVDHCGDNSDENYAYARCKGPNPMMCMFTNDSMCKIYAKGWLSVNKLPSHALYGPKADHTTGQPNGGHFVYTPFSTSSDNDIAHLFTPELSLNNTHCLTFWYYMYGPRIGKLRVYVDGTQMFRSPTWSRVGSQGDQWLPGQVEINATGKVKVVFEGENRDRQNVMALDDISILQGPCNGEDISCNFETGTCGWTPSLSVQNYHGNADWGRNKSGVTLGRPPKDHSSIFGDGWYLFLQAPSPRQSGYRALIVSPPLPIVSPKNTKCLSFWYYMSSNDSASCVISVLMFHSSGLLGGKVLTLTAKHRHVWLLAQSQLVHDKPYQIVLEGVIIGNHVGEIAVDQIMVRDGTCTPPDWPDSGAGSPSTDSPSCVHGHFRCRNGRCIRPELLCDSVDDCGDLSDEFRCRYSTTTDKSKTTLRQPAISCGAGEYRCARGKCIPRTHVCDNNNDCGDSSDEDWRAQCASDKTTPVPRCYTESFACQNRNLCLSRSKICDGRDDCGDGSDEDYRYAGCQVIAKSETWTIGTILAVVFGCVGLIVLIVICVAIFVFKFRKRQRQYHHHSRNPVVAFINSNLQSGQVMTESGEPPPYLVHIDRDFGFILDRSLVRRPMDRNDGSLPLDEPPPPYDTVVKENARNPSSAVDSSTPSAAGGAGNYYQNASQSSCDELTQSPTSTQRPRSANNRRLSPRHLTGPANHSNVSADSTCPILAASADVYCDPETPASQPRVNSPLLTGGRQPAEVYAPMSTGSSHSASVPIEERYPADRSPYALYDADARNMIDAHEYAEIPANLVSARPYPAMDNNDPPEIPNTPRPFLGLPRPVADRPAVTEVVLTRGPSVRYHHNDQQPSNQNASSSARQTAFADVRYQPEESFT